MPTPERRLILSYFRREETKCPSLDAAGVVLGRNRAASTGRAKPTGKLKLTTEAFCLLTDWIDMHLAKPLRAGKVAVTPARLSVNTKSPPMADGLTTAKSGKSAIKQLITACCAGIRTRVRALVRARDCATTGSGHYGGFTIKQGFGHL